MKSHTMISMLFAIYLVIGGCSGDNSGAESGQSDQVEMPDQDHTAHGKMNMDSGEPADESIYHVNSSWKNRHGQQVQLDDLRGRVQVMAMVYTHCEHACPRILADMQRIRDALSAEVLNETRFVIVSIDPERDTPRRLTQFANENNLAEDQWTLLNGNQWDVLELAALLGVRYKRISDTDFTHSNMISVLTKEGEVAYQRKKLADQHTGIVRAIEQSASK